MKIQGQEAFDIAFAQIQNCTLCYAAQIMRSFFGASIKHLFVLSLLLTHTPTHTRKNCVELVEGVGRKTARMCSRNG